MGNFCEAFGLTSIEAPSSKAKRIQKKSATQIKKPSRPNYSKPVLPKKVPPNKKKQPFKTPVTYFKCGNQGHKATECKVEQKANELFIDKPKLRDKVLAILAHSQSEFDKDYYQDTYSEDSAYSTSPIQINVITTNNQKKNVSNRIGQTPDLDQRKEYLENLTDIILTEEEKPKYFQDY